MGVLLPTRSLHRYRARHEKGRRECLCLLRVKPGNAHNEPRLSAFRPVAIAKGEVEFGCQVVIQAPKTESRIMRCEHTEHEWAAIKPFLPNRPRGMPRERSPIMSLDSRFFDDRGQMV